MYWALYDNGLRHERVNDFWITSQKRFSMQYHE